MKPNELRIGNYVMFQDNQTIFKVNEISEIGLGVEDENESTWIELEYFEEITLTEEMLLKMGFERKSYFTTVIVIECVYYQLKDFVVYLLPNSFEVELVTKSGEQFNLYKNFKKEMHILQNIYFVLKGEELSLKTRIEP